MSKNTTSAAYGTVYTIQAPQGLSLDFMAQGATWLACRVPMPGGGQREVVLGCPDRAAYAAQTAYVGATVGRYANRIRDGRIDAGAGPIQLDVAPGSPHQLHGGPVGFDKREWQVRGHTLSSLRLLLDSKAGDQGFPGRLQVQMDVRLTDAMTVEFDVRGEIDAPSPVGITQHSYFNLDATPGDVRAHRLRIAADQVLPVDETLIPLGHLQDVADTAFDFRVARPVRLQSGAAPLTPEDGHYDHAFLLDATTAKARADAVELWSADQRLRMAIATTLPSIQLYTGAVLEGIASSRGGKLVRHGGIALEPQFLPDSPNHPEWPQPSCWLQPGVAYRQVMRYRFEAQ